MNLAKLQSPILLIIASTFFIHACAVSTDHSRAKNDHFVDIREVIPLIQLDIRYYTKNNFVGSLIDGYRAPKCWLTREAANALKEVNQKLAKRQLALKIFDCYRPQRAVAHFVRWGKDLGDQQTKAEYYPSVDKQILFEEGYLARKSSHSRGSTVDLTLIDRTTQRELDMGSPYDFFDPLSHTANSGVGKIPLRNRETLKSVMERQGFKNLEKEWWHFTYKNEPFPNQYFDLVIE